MFNGGNIRPQPRLGPCNGCPQLHAGQTVALDSTILEMGDKLVVFHHHLRIVPGGEVAMSIFYRCVLLDLDRRRAIVVPEDIRAAARARFPGLIES